MSWLLNSSIGRKFTMALSGCFLILFLLFHMSMNLVLVFSKDAYNEICEMLGANWYAIIASLILAGGFLLHILLALKLTLQNKKARGANGYESSSSTEASWSSKNMFVLGLVVLAFLGMHLCDFWYKMQFKELIGDPTAVSAGASLVSGLFQNPVYVILYLIGTIALWFHLSHGFASMFQSVGINNRIWLPRLKCLSYIVATIIAVGFAIVPIFFYVMHSCCAGTGCGM